MAEVVPWQRCDTDSGSAGDEDGGGAFVQPTETYWVSTLALPVLTLRMVVVVRVIRVVMKTVINPFWKNECLTHV